MSEPADFDDLVDQVMLLLQQQGRVSWRGLRRRFALDDEDVLDLRDELVEARRVAVDEDGRVLALARDAAQAAVAERRLLTVMFCDVVGSTALATRLDPEQLRERLQAYQRGVGRIVERWGGHVAQYLGDGLLIYFGYPRSHEDDPQRALRCALQIVEDVRDDQTAERLQIRIGVHVGPVVVGDVGSGPRREQLALGDTPNIAARIQSEARPDAILLSDALARLAGDAFKLQDIGRFRLKGLDAPMPLFRLRGLSGVLQEHDGLFVGRVEELKWLDELLDAPAQAGLQLRCLWGEPGSGKSRLVAEWLARLSAQRCRYVHLRASPYHTDDALYPLRNAGRSMLRAGSSPAGAQQRLSEIYEQLGLPAEQLPALAAWLGVAAPAAGKQRLDIAVLQRLLENLLLDFTRQRVLVVVVDNLQWLDPSTRDWLQAASDACLQRPLRVVVTGRAEAKRWWKRSSLSTDAVQERQLGPLSDDEAVQLCSALCDARPLSGELTARMLERAGGMPLYLESLCRAVCNAPELVETPSGWSLPLDARERLLPADLRGALMAQLDALSPPAKALAQLAAVLGRGFPYALLAAASELPEASLLHEVAELISADILIERGSGDTADYRFRLTMLQQMAYESLLLADRKRHHRRLAELLRERFPEEVEQQPQAMARHYAAAGEPLEALRWSLRAGQRAYQRSANAEAIGYLQAGLELLEQQPESAERDHSESLFIGLLIPAVMVTSGFASSRAGELLKRGAALQARHSAPPTVQFMLMAGQFLHELIGGAVAKARLQVQGIELLVKTLSDERMRQAAVTMHATLDFDSGDFESALRQYDGLLEGLDSSSYSAENFIPGFDPIVIACAEAALMHWLRGDVAASDRYAWEAEAVARQIDEPFAKAIADSWRGWLHLARGQDALALEAAQQALAVSGSFGYQWYRGVAIMLQGSVTGRCGDPEAGLMRIREGMAVLEATGSLSWMPVFRCELGRVMALTGPLDAAREQFLLASREMRRSGARWWRAGLHWRLGQVELAAARADLADVSMRKAWEVAQLQGAVTIAQDARQLMMDAWEAAEQPARAALWRDR